MNEKTFNEAVENISVIKEIIDRTSRSFMAFSKIFFYWGLLFILNSVITLLMLINKDRIFDVLIRYPLINYVFPIGFISILAIIIYRVISIKIPLVGLEKHLMKVWLLVLIINFIPIKISVYTANTSVDLGNISVEVSRFSITLLSLSVALIVTSFFTGFKQLSYVGVIYIIISAVYAYFDLHIFGDVTIKFLSLIALPFTFLYTGFFLKAKTARGKQSGY